ncbi:RHS repeat-associated core domain-containing protein [Luteimonas huabeiensis]|uniref:RHS repeat-associated core domain-containing protein n=1 Tax=Luteimonas huabeiensis TaxID=1244513 RepID=UPI0009DFC7D4|nr:RHS repeat-associated core domain-containing protein [Luteimonas huabeiensis]
MAHARKSIWAISLLLVSTASHAQTRVKYIHTDTLGSVVAVTDASRTVLERREYEPYGQQLAPGLQDGPGYTGHVQDAATGMVYMQQRYYDPGIGLFLSADPVTALGGPVGQFNRYRYASSSPYKFLDPDGRLACTGTRIMALCTGRNSLNLLRTSVRSPLDSDAGGSASTAQSALDHYKNAGSASERYAAASSVVRSVSDKVKEIRHKTYDSAAQTADHVFQPISERFGVEILSNFDGGLGAGYYIVDVRVGRVFSNSGLGYTVLAGGGATPTHHTHPVVSSSPDGYRPFSASDIDWFRSTRAPVHYVSDPTGLYRFNGVGIVNPVTRVPRLGK